MISFCSVSNILTTGRELACYNEHATMQHPHSRQLNDRVITENDLPVNIFQVIDDVTVNGAVLVLRKNRPSVRIMPEAEIDPEQEQVLLQEAVDVRTSPDFPWFGSAEAFVANLEDGDAK